MKYGIWNIGQPSAQSVNALAAGGYSPLTAMVLAGRSISSRREAEEYLSVDAVLSDPFAIRDMDKAAGRVGLAMTRGEKIAVFGDYDVDGITATCLLTDFLRRQGANCISYIPGRLEEGYGLNPIAIDYLHEQQVDLIITVDCGITALSEAALCRELGIDLVITDHHECKDYLPEAIAIVDPHRPDCTSGQTHLSGVGVAFKLICALTGAPEEMLQQYADMVCLGTVADVMPLKGENRLFVAEGLKLLQNTTRPGIAALISESGAAQNAITASTIGYVLAPRINAAGRMGQIQLAIDLFLTEDPQTAAQLAAGLCELNRQRQSVESEIYAQAISMLPQGQSPSAIVLADESWHQGVVGIVASRIAEEYSCPTFLICLDGEHGKASSRSFGGFNLFASLTTLSHLLESYGGHELAAGFTINRENIPRFREQVSLLAEAYYSDDTPRTCLDIDCEVPPELLTIPGIQSLDILEPCGCGCPKPVLMMRSLTIDRVSTVGNGRHTRLRLRRDRQYFNAIFFCTTPEGCSIELGDVVDVAFVPQINDFRGTQSVQMNVLDIRPSCSVECSMDLSAYRALTRGTLTAEDAASLLPDRSTLALVWRFLASVPDGRLEETPICLCRKIVRRSGISLGVGQLLTCLDIFQDVNLITIQRINRCLALELVPQSNKVDLNESKTMQLLLRAKES